MSSTNPLHPTESTTGQANALLAEQFKPFEIHDPFPFYELARAGAPLFYHAELGYWVVTRYEDIKAIFKDPETFSSEVTQTPYKPRPTEVQRVLDEGVFTGNSGL